MSRKILIVAPSWVGDMVMAQSLFKLIKAHDPSVSIDVLAPAWTFPLLQCMPEISYAIQLPFSHGQFKLFERFKWAKKLREQHYQQAIVLPHSFKSALIPWFAGIPQRTGWLGEFRYGLLNDIRYLHSKKIPRMVEQFTVLGLPKNDSLPEKMIDPRLEIKTDAAIKIRSKHQLSSHRPVLALCAGAEYGSSKRWPAENFAIVANQKIKEGWQVWLLGSSNDKPITEEIMMLTDNACKNIAGQTPLDETIHLLSLVDGVVTNDSGLMHIAAALDKPLIALYGSTSPTFTPPLSKKAIILKLDLPCQPCFKRQCPLKHHRCMRDLRPDDVLQKMNDWEH